MIQEIEELPMDDSTTIELREYIYDLVRTEKPSICVEVGTHKGVTALYIASALRDNEKGMLYTVDPTDYGIENILKGFDDVRPHITYLQKKGIELEIDNIDFLFIDGFHEYECVRDEIQHFLPRLNDGAHVLFHDCGGDNEFVGVNRAIDEAGLNAPVINFGDSKSRLYLHRK